MDILDLFLYILDSQAKDQAQRNIDQIKRQLAESEIKHNSDTRYLEGELKGFGQLPNKRDDGIGDFRRK
jgi:hypothetical protein